MGKRKPPQQTWKVHLEIIYPSDRDERIRKAYEIALPEAITKQPKSIEEGKENESGQCRLCSSVK
jgi:hypothetical protein